jgi:hypothetical protein
MEHGLNTDKTIRPERAVWYFTVAVMVLCAGCMKSKVGGTVSGKVDFRNKPVAKGAITFHAADGETAMGKIEDGTYRVEKPPLGPCKVTILTVPPPPPGTGIDPDPKTLRPPGYLEVPERYGKVQTTDLKVEVIKDPQTKDFHLKP